MGKQIIHEFHFLNGSLICCYVGDKVLKKLFYVNKTIEGLPIIFIFDFFLVKGFQIFPLYSWVFCIIVKSENNVFRFILIIWWLN